MHWYFFYNAGLIFTATKLSKGLRGRAEPRAWRFYCNSFLITHFLSNKSARVQCAYDLIPYRYSGTRYDWRQWEEMQHKRTVAIGYRDNVMRRDNTEGRADWFAGLTSPALATRYSHSDDTFSLFRVLKLTFRINTQVEGLIQNLYS